MSLSATPAPGLHDAAPFPAPAAQQLARTAHDDLQARLLRAGREAVDDRELLQLLLTGSHPAPEASQLATVLLDTFGTPARVLAARPGTLRTVAGLGEAGIAAIKTAEALGIAMAKAALPETLHPQLATYEKVVEYCRSLAAHRDVEVFHVLFLNTRNVLICDEVHQTGTINHTPVYPRQVCVRALEVGAASLVVVHQHPSNDPTPSRADVEMTSRLRDALKTIDVDLHDHIVVTAGDAFSFRQKGLL
jgi:DNA repair protein RadC